MRILGVSAFYHDSAAALVVNGNIVGAAQEERFTRVKHDSRFPRNAVDFCLKSGGVSLDEVDYIVFYEKPFLKFERLLETYIAFAPRGFTSFVKAVPVWLREKLFQKSLLIKELQNISPKFNSPERLLFSDHHLSHSASAFFASPYENAVVVTMDGVGEWPTTSVGIGRGNKLSIEKEIHFPHSLGLLYSAFTYFTGFKVNSGEYKLMGLAPYGKPVFKDKILNHLIALKEDGSFAINQEYFDYCTGLTMTNDKFASLFGIKPRDSNERLEQIHMDIAASIQVVLEEAVLNLTRKIAKQYGIKNLCLAGGVALNCVANGKILRDGHFENIWIQPAAGDAGGALGAALVAHYVYTNGQRAVGTNEDSMRGSYLGPEFSDEQVEKSLRSLGAKYERLPDDDALVEKTALAIANGAAVGWFQGRMEFGPRALGNRSILADARSEKMQKTLNLKVKFRESFRPFAPSVLREEVGNWFELDCDSPYMLLVADVAKKHRIEMTEEQEKYFGIEKLNVSRSSIPAVTHVDYSARIQTVHESTNRKYHSLIKRFKKETGCPVVVNTSFNVRGEPIVCTPEDAFKCFMGTDLDVLAIGNFYLKKSEQNPILLQDYKDKFELD